MKSKSIGCLHVGIWILLCRWEWAQLRCRYMILVRESSRVLVANDVFELDALKVNFVLCFQNFPVALFRF